MSEADDGAIRAIIAGQDEAWSRGNAAAFSKHMAGDLVATNVQGQSMSDKGRFDRQHEFIFGNVFKGSELTQKIATLRYLSESIAFVETIVKVSELTNPPAMWSLDPEGSLETRLLQVLDKSAGEWSIVAYHNTAVNHRAPPLVA